jgi:hypothetical protein
VKVATDRLSDKKRPTKIAHDALSSGGGIGSVLAKARDPHTEVAATVSQDGAKRVMALRRMDPAWNGGSVAWIRGSNSFTLPSYRGAHLPEMLNQNEFYYPELLMRRMLTAFGHDFLVEKRESAQRNPVMVVSRHRNAFFFAGYSPNVTVSQAFRLAFGAPLLGGLETRIVDGHSTYHMPKAWRRECRVFVDQREDSEISCLEQFPGMVGVSRRIALTGLSNATVRFFFEPGGEAKVAFLRNPRAPYLKGDFVKPEMEAFPEGNCLAVKDISGSLLISW